MSYKKPPVTPSESQVSFRQFDKPSLQSEDLSLKPNHLQFPRNKAVSLLSLLLFVCFILGRKDGVGGGGAGGLGTTHTKTLQRRQNVSHEKPKVKTRSMLSKRTLLTAETKM